MNQRTKRIVAPLVVVAAGIAGGELLGVWDGEKCPAFEAKVDDGRIPGPGGSADTTVGPPPADQVVNNPDEMVPTTWINPTTTSMAGLRHRTTSTTLPTAPYQC